jgi:hypothetical protein
MDLDGEYAHAFEFNQNIMDKRKKRILKIGLLLHCKLQLKKRGVRL